MTLKAFLSLCILVSCFLPRADCQHPLVSSHFRINALVHAGGHEPGITDYNRLILREIAKEVLKEPWQVRILVSAEFSLAISGDSRDSLLISLWGLKVSGDTLYRGFGIGTALIPAGMEMVLHRANKSDTTSFTRLEPVRIMINGQDTIVASVPIGLFDPEVDTLLTETIRYSYDSVVLMKLMTRLGLIHDYYASLAILDSLGILAAQIGLTRPSSIPQAWYLVEEMNRALASIERTGFRERLLSGGDPGRLVARYGELFRTGRSLTYNFLDAVRNSGVIEWDDDTRRFAFGFTGRLESWIMRSQWMDRQQGPIYRRFLANRFDGPAFPEDTSVTMLMLRKMYPDAAPDTLETFFYRQIWSAMMQRTAELVRSNRYAEAFDLAGCAISFSRSARIPEAIPDLEAVRQEAAEGILNSFTGIAEGCIATGKFSMADTYLGKAREYAEANRQWIRSDTMFRRVYSHLFFLRNTGCDGLLKSERYSDALNCYEEIARNYPSKDLRAIESSLASRMDRARIGLWRETMEQAATALRSGTPELALNLDSRATAIRQAIGTGTAGNFGAQDSIAPEIAALKYDRLVEEGTAAIDKRQFTLSLGIFDQASQLAARFALRPAPGFDSLYRRSRLHAMIIGLSNAQRLIWAARYDTARLVLDKARQEGADYRLNGDPHFDSAIVRFERKILEQQCRDLSDSVGQRIIRADRFAALKNFIRASRTYSEAIAMVRPGPACRLDTAALLDSLKKYTPAARFQELLDSAGVQTILGEYLQATMTIRTACIVYDSNRLGRFGLPPSTLPGFAEERNNPLLTMQAARVLLGTGDLPGAMECLRLLRAQGVSAKQAGPILDDFGIAAAAIQNESIVKDLPEMAAEGDPWFQQLRESHNKAKISKRQDQ